MIAINRLKWGIDMNIALAVLAGLVWGALAALLGGVITRRSLAKNSTSAVLIGNLLRTLTDLAALGLVFLGRKLLPFDYTWMLIATAVALSVGTIVISYRIAGKK